MNFTFFSDFSVFGGPKNQKNLKNTKFIVKHNEFRIFFGFFGFFGFSRPGNYQGGLAPRPRISSLGSQTEDVQTWSTVTQQRFVWGIALCDVATLCLFDVALCDVATLYEFQREKYDLVKTIMTDNISLCNFKTDILAL